MTHPARTPRKVLIVNADDLGMSDGVNRGILEAHLSGVVTSTTALVNMPTAAAGIALVQKHAPELGLGLHLNLTYGKPVLPAKEVSSLVRTSGAFVGATRGLVSPRRWRTEHVVAEMTAQLDKFVALTGKLPDHLDSHQLVGSLSPVCRAVMLDLAERYDLPVRRGGRAALGKLEQAMATRGAVGRAVAPPLFRRWPRPAHAEVYDRTPPEPNFIEIGFFGTGASLSNLLNILENLPDGVTEIVCHPGYIDDANDAYPTRELELKLLTDPAVRQKIIAEGIKLATFDYVRPQLEEVARELNEG